MFASVLAKAGKKVVLLEAGPDWQLSDLISSDFWGRRVKPAGPPFLRYVVIDMDRELAIEVGVPVASPIEGAGDIKAGTLPGGRYAVLTHTGAPATLLAANKALLDWAAGQGLSWDMSDSADGQRWGCRLEIWLTDPSEQPDMTKWETQLAFRLAD